MWRARARIGAHCEVRTEPPPVPTAVRRAQATVAKTASSSPGEPYWAPADVSIASGVLPRVRENANGDAAPAAGRPRRSLARTRDAPSRGLCICYESVADLLVVPLVGDVRQLRAKRAAQRLLQHVHCRALRTRSILTAEATRRRPLLLCPGLGTALRLQAWC